MGKAFLCPSCPHGKGFRHQTTKFLYRLVGSEDMAVDQSIVSPYTSRILKPYIRCTERRSHVECRGGVDLSECLQYPDFSVVVLYKKVIIAFGFMVPDVKYNEAYISFLFVHPEWRRAGIATFMIYHLIQTCMGKDVTLHVSASNPAMLLYQKFGFKTEDRDERRGQRDKESAPSESLSSPFWTGLRPTPETPPSDKTMVCRPPSPTAVKQECLD
ncbi:hypothetical protein CB1_000637016 [Camelus ferus]|nr:hypothetical protein CB1_000637016 [Camelus ferus]